MGKILRTNVFTGEREWVDFEAGVEVLNDGWNNPKTYSTAWTTEHKSLAAAVHSSQAAEFNEFYKSHNIAAYHDKDGVLHSSDRNAFNRVQQVRGLFNRDAGYGDYAGR